MFKKERIGMQNVNTESVIENTANVQMFKYGDVELPVKTYADGSIEFDAEQAAIGFGLFEVKNGKKYVIWKRVNKYLSTEVSKGDFITEPQFYKLAIKANNQVAEKFRNWVTSDVLPSIRKHGAYMTDAKIEEVLTDPDTIIKLAQQLKTERQGRLIAEQRVNELQPKANYLDKILANKSLVTITQIAKDYGMSGQEMNALLHSLKVQYRQSGTWLLYSKYQRTGWTQSYSKPITHKDGTPGMVMTTKWTQKGRLGLYELLKDHDVLPLIEQDVEA